MNVLELYSGIGGMHYAFNACGTNGNVVCAMDINTTANTVYKHNFPKSRLLQRNIQSLTSQEINDMEIDMILMSPPCQPFTRVGLKKDVNDGRTESFLHILELLPRVNDRLKYILLENVKGFESSEAREQLITVLQRINFIYQEFLLSPDQFGIPNTRLRYYIIAKRMPLNFCFEKGSLMRTFPVQLDESPTTDPLVKKMMQLNSHHRSLALQESDTNKQSCYSVKQILEDNVVDQEYLLPEKILGKHGWLLDVVTPSCKRSCCFTKAYGHYVEGTGSVLCSHSLEKICEIYEMAKAYESASKEQVDLLRTLELRYFTPKEIARLMCFPETFSFPNDITRKQKYRLLGNSINVHVVSLLIALLTPEDEPS